jgi:hypothetical protein
MENNGIFKIIINYLKLHKFIHFINHLLICIKIKFVIKCEFNFSKDSIWFNNKISFLNAKKI